MHNINVFISKIRLDLCLSVIAELKRLTLRLSLTAKFPSSQNVAGNIG